MKRFIVGDTMPDAVHGQGSEKRMSSSVVSLLAADVFRLVSRVRSRVRLSQLPLTGGPAFVYERYALFQELGSVMKRRTGTQWILEVNALLAVEATSERRATSSRAVAQWMERRTLTRADTIVAVTEALAEQLAIVYSIPRDRIIVVANGVDDSAHSAVAVGETPSAPRIGFLGTLYPWQNVASLLALMTEGPAAKAVLDIAGDGPERAALERQAREAGIADRVVFRGRVHPDEVPGFLSEVDICFAGHSSANGTYFSPLKLWEYLAAGKPVVASRHSVTTELQEQGYPVVCYDPSGPEDLATVLALALSSLDELTRRAADKQADVWSEHSWGSRVESILDAVRTAA